MRRRQRGLQFYRKKKKISTAAVREFFSWVVLVVLAVFLAFMVICLLYTSDAADE